MSTNKGRRYFRRTIRNIRAMRIAKVMKVIAEGIVLYLIFQISITAGLLAVVAAVIPVLDVTIFEQEEGYR